MNLYDEFVHELKTLTSLVLHAKKNNQTISLDDAIIEQSRKVDMLVDKITQQHTTEKTNNIGIDNE